MSSNETEKSSSDVKGRLQDTLAIAVGVIPPRWLLVCAALSLGILGEVLYAFAARPWLATFSASLLFSLAALVGGGLFGFLFGLPHAGASASSSSRNPPRGQGSGTGAADQGALDLGSQESEVTPSTNLQQIADWLTKLIIGAGLTQLGRLPHASFVLFHAMSPRDWRIALRDGGRRRNRHLFRCPRIRRGLARDVFLGHTSGRARREVRRLAHRGVRTSRSERRSS